MSIFSKKFEIDYILVKSNLEISFANLMRYVQETSTAHTQSTEFPISWFSDNMTGWVITNWQVKVKSYPKYADIITAKTWPTKFKGMMADRSFAFYDKEGNCFLEALSSWIYMDVKNKKPLRPDQAMVDSYGKAHEQLFEKNYNMPDMISFEKIDEYNYTIHRRDIDSNFHVNNIRYLEWAQDGIPDDIYENCNVAQMRTRYRKECSRGDNIIINTYRNKLDNKEFVTLIKRRENGEETVLTEVYTKWE